MLLNLYDKTLSLANHKRADNYLALVSFAESSVFPIPPDIILAPMVLAKPNKFIYLAFLTTICSVLGAFLGYFLGFIAFEPFIEPLIKLFSYQDSYYKALGLFNKYGFIAILLAGFITPIPYKLFTIGAGVLNYNLFLFFIASVLGRSARFFLVAGLVKLFGKKFDMISRKIISKLGWGILLLLIALVFLSSCTKQNPAGVKVEKITVAKKKINKKNNLNYHIVKEGETLYSIAWKNSLDYNEIAKINNIKPPYLIHKGQNIVLKNTKKNINIKSNLALNSVLKTNIKTNSSNEISSKSNTKNKLLDQKWIWPVKGKIISNFSYDKLNKNNGIKISGKLGEPVYAANSGKIVYSGNRLRGYGNLIILKHDDNLLSAYALNKVNFVKEGDIIKRGQKIALLGYDDKKNPMLHFEIRRNGKPIDPKKILK